MLQIKKLTTKNLLTTTFFSSMFKEKLLGGFCLGDNSK